MYFIIRIFKKYLFFMQYFVEYEIDISFYFHNFFFGFKFWPLGTNLNSVPDLEHKYVFTNTTMHP